MARSERAKSSSARLSSESSRYSSMSRRTRFSISSFALTCADRKSTRLNSCHLGISYAVFCLKKKNIYERIIEVLGKLRADAAQALGKCPVELHTHSAKKDDHAGHTVGRDDHKGV